MAAYQPLTKEQYQKAIDAGFSHDSIVQNELKRKQSFESTTTPAPTSAGMTLTGSDNPVGSLPVIKQLTQFGTGLGTATLKAGLGLGQAAGKLAGGIAGLFGAKKAQNYLGNTLPTGIETIKKEVLTKPYQTELNSMSGKVGTFTGTVAPYIESAGAVSKITNKASSLGVKAAELFKPGSKALSTTFKILSGASAEGAQNYILGYALSGGNKKEALTQGLTAGFLKGATSTLGEALKGVKVDEKLMNTIYKSDKKEEAGILFGNRSKTLAREAIDRGLTGNVKQQAIQVQQGLNNAESKIATEFEKAGNPLIQLNNPQRYVDAIEARIGLLKKSGATQEAQGLQSSLRAISPDGKITANNALGLRRLLDSMRQAKAFMAQTEELGAQQAGLKEMADSLRHQINKIGETNPAMKDYQFFMDAKDKLIKYAVSSKNKNTIDFFDRLIFAESVYAHTPIGLGIIGARKAALFRPATAAQAINKLSTSSPTGTAIRGITSKAIGSVTTPTQ